MASSQLDSDDNERWDSATDDPSSLTMGDEDDATCLPLTQRTDTMMSQGREGEGPLPALVSDSDSDDESGWNMGGYSSGSSDTSDGEYIFNGNVSDASDDSSIGDDDDDYGMFEMLTNHFDVFNNFVPAFFGVSLQMLYARIMENITLDEERDSPTPQHILDLLPATKVTQTQVASNMSCCICFCDYVVDEDLLELPCTHIYHRTCILDWLKIKCTCPTCRCDLTTNTTYNNDTSEVSELSGDNTSSSENLVYSVDREHIYDTIESYNAVTNLSASSLDNITDIPDMSASSRHLNININTSASTEMRTPIQSVQQNLTTVVPSTTSSSNTTARESVPRTRMRTRYVTTPTSSEGASSNSGTGVRDTTSSEGRTRSYTENRPRQNNENRTRNTDSSRRNTTDGRSRSGTDNRNRSSECRNRASDNRTRTSDNRIRSNDNRTRSNDGRSRSSTEDSSIQQPQQSRTNNKSAKRFSRETEIW